MEGPKFTALELAALTDEAVHWMNQQREIFHPPGASLTNIQKQNLLPFFTTEILDRVRIVNLSLTGETLPDPPFYERVRADGFRLVPDAVHMAAIPFVDVAVFNKEPTMRTIFHTLVHVVQFTLVGLERCMEVYFRVLNESRLWLVVPFEEQAYQMDARFTRNPTNLFSVEEEIREWLRSDRYSGTRQPG